MYFTSKNNPLQLDIVGIVAILGEGSILRNAQASALSWHHVLPRLIPAPQALLKHQQTKRLPTQKGIVSGVYSGNVRHELNFFTQLLHPGELTKYQIEVVKVTRDPDCNDNDFIFGVNDYGVLPLLSFLGCLMSCVLLALSVWRKDGFALIATILLSVTSTIVGFASRWTLNFKEEKPQNETKAVIPDGDVVIYYPGPGAFRVIQCNEVISRLYFQAEECVPLLGDNRYRVVAMAGSVTLIFGLICLSNAHIWLQIGFAIAYVILNALYWASSAYNERHHWSHAYTVTPIEIFVPRRSGTTLYDIEVPAEVLDTGPHPPSRRTTAELEANGKQFPQRKLSLASLRKWTGLPVPMKKSDTEIEQHYMPQSMHSFTDILWTAIALTRSTRWLRSPILPDTEVWEKWVAAAAKESVGDLVRVGDKILLPRWDYKKKLKELFAEEKEEKKNRPKWPTLKEMSRLITPERAKPKLLPIVEAVQARMQQESELSPGVQQRRTLVQFADDVVYTNSPVDETEGFHHE